MEARALRETGNCPVVTNCSNAFNTVNRKALLAEVAHCVPALTPFAAKRYDARPACVRCWDGFRGDPDDRLVQRGPTGGPTLPWAALLCLPFSAKVEPFPR